MSINNKLTRDEVLRLAREAGLPVRGYYDENGATPAELERFAALVAAAELGKARRFEVDQAIGAAVAAERAKHQSEIQHLVEKANSAEKWRGVAMARNGDGRTVQEVQEEARAEEREACAKVCDELHDQWRWADDDTISGPSECAAAIRARRGG